MNCTKAYYKLFCLAKQTKKSKEASKKSHWGQVLKCHFFVNLSLIALLTVV